MAPAPLPADPTLLTSPLTNQNIHNTSSCASRRFPPSIAESLIEESLNNHRPTDPQFVPNDCASQSNKKNGNTIKQGSRINFSCLRNKVNVSNTNYETGISNQLRDKGSNDTQKSCQKELHEDKETTFVNEVPRRFNRLSLKKVLLYTELDVYQKFSLSHLIFNNFIDINVIYLNRSTGKSLLLNGNTIQKNLKKSKSKEPR